MTCFKRSEIHEHIKAGTLDQNMAMDFLVESLADMHEAINGVRPVRANVNEPAYMTMIRWMPILADYQMFAQRANRSAERVAIAEEQVKKYRREANEADSRMMNKLNAFAYLKPSIKSLIKVLNNAVEILDKHENPGSGWNGLD